MAVCDTIKERHYLYSGVTINRASTFFAPFTSFSDFKTQLRSPIIIPIVGLSLILHAAVNTGRNLLETAINLFFFDNESLKTSVPAFFDSAVQATYYAASCIIDALWNFTALICRILTTAVYGIPRVIEAIAQGILSSENVLQRL